MPNPLTQSRKLGFPLVGKDGFLTGLMRFANGVGPMEQLKNALAARRQFDEDAKREIGAQQDQLGLDVTRQNLAQGEQQLQMGELNLDKGRKAAADTAAADEAYAAGMKAPNVGAARGGFEAQRDLQALGKSDEMTALHPEDIELYRTYGIDIKPFESIPADENGVRKISTKTLDFINSRMKAKDALEARRLTMQEAAARRNQITPYQGLQIGGSAGDDYTQAIKEPLEIVNRAKMIDATVARAGGLGNLRAKLSGPLSEQVLVTWERLLDPNSVVREGEFVRALENTPLAMRWDTWLNKLNSGGHLTPQLIEEYVDLIHTIAEEARLRGKSVYEDTVKWHAANGVPMRPTIKNYFDTPFATRQRPQGAGAGSAEGLSPERRKAWVDR